MRRTLLFVYGSLRRGLQNAYSIRLAREAAYLGAATMRGCLYRVASYPGMQPDFHKRSIVSGDIYRLRHHSTLRWLDDYEGYVGSKPREFARELHTARMPDGCPMQVWVYVYRRCTRRVQRLSSGDYLQEMYETSRTGHGPAGTRVRGN
ncbi:MAG: gamma-glutamylcyclotransferase [Gammaproteobacteria bacterium]|nr:gamma-glutamylcyclotransferase [Gammaproteobacteria bacterium]